MNAVTEPGIADFPSSNARQIGGVILDLKRAA